MSRIIVGIRGDLRRRSVGADRVGAQRGAPVQHISRSVAAVAG